MVKGTKTFVIMDYEKKYKEALERARKCLDENRDTCFVRPDVIFPELKESEDERIRKHLIEDLKWRLNGALDQDANGCDRQKDIEAYKWGITWLERQALEAKPKWSEEMKFKKFDIITNGKIEYEIKDIQKNQLGDWVYILYNDSIARLVVPLSSLPDGSIRWVCEQVDEQFELKQRIEE